MARITVEDCLDHVDNRFSLVMVATRRAREEAIVTAAKRRGDRALQRGALS